MRMVPKMGSLSALDWRKPKSPDTGIQDMGIRGIGFGSLGLCERCGGLKVVSCSKCKGLGTLSKGTLSIFSGIASDRRVGQEDASMPCRDCGSKGSLNCPKCSGA